MRFIFANLAKTTQKHLDNYCDIAENSLIASNGLADANWLKGKISMLKTRRQTAHSIRQRELDRMFSNQHMECAVIDNGQIVCRCDSLRDAVALKYYGRLPNGSSVRNFGTNLEIVEIQSRAVSLHRISETLNAIRRDGFDCDLKSDPEHVIDNGDGRMVTADELRSRRRDIPPAVVTQADVDRLRDEIDSEEWWSVG